MVAGWLLVLGVVLFFVTALINKQLGISPSRWRDMDDLRIAGPAQLTTCAPFRLS